MIVLKRSAIRQPADFVLPPPIDVAERRERIASLLAARPELRAVLRDPDAFGPSGNLNVKRLALTLGMPPEATKAFLAGCRKPKPDTNHVDPVEFNELFAKRRQNHEAICLGLRTIVRGAARGVRFANEDDREDAIGDAVLHSIQAIRKFRYNRQSNACGFFVTVATRKLMREAKKAKRRMMRPLDLSADL